MDGNNFISKTVAASAIKVGRCIELTDLMNLDEYQKSRSFFTFARGHLVFKLKSFFSKTVDLFESKCHVEDFGRTEIIIYTNGLGHITQMAAMPIFGKCPSKTFFPRTSGPIASKLGM